MTKARQVRPAYGNEHVPRAKTGMVESFEPVLGGFLCSRVSFQLVGCRGWFLEGLRGAPKPTDGLDLPTIPATTPNGRHHHPHVHCRGLEEKRGGTKCHRMVARCDRHDGLATGRRFARPIPLYLLEVAGRLRGLSFTFASRPVICQLGFLLVRSLASSGRQPRRH